MPFPSAFAEGPFQCSNLKFVDDHLMSEWVGKKTQSTVWQFTAKQNNVNWKGNIEEETILKKHLENTFRYFINLRKIPIS